MYKDNMMILTLIIKIIITIIIIILLKIIKIIKVIIMKIYIKIKFMDLHKIKIIFIIIWNSKIVQYNYKIKKIN
jgi:hypothetical protein